MTIIIGETKPSDSFKILLVAPNGVGKTLALSSFFKAGPIHIDEFDGRWEPINTHYPNSGISIDTYGVDDLNNFMDKLEGYIKTPPTVKGKRVKTYAIDSVTSLSITAVFYNRSAKGNAKTTKGGLPTSSWDDLNGETGLITTALEICKVINEKYGINIIWTAHPVIKNEVTKTENADGTTKEDVKKVPTLTAYGYKVPQLIPGYFNEIYYLAVKKKTPTDFRRVAYTSLSVNEEVIAKTAYMLPSELDITDGLYPALMKALRREMPTLEPSIPLVK